MLTHTYRVVYVFGGFGPPVDGAALDGVTAGEAVPLEFSLGGDFGLAAVAAVTWTPVSCDGSGTAGAASAAQARLSYNASTGRYMDVVATDPSWAGTCRRLDLVLADGASHPVRVRFGP